MISAGADLQVADVQVTAPLEDCASMGVLSASAATPATPAARAPPRHWPPACANVTAASWYALLVGPQEMKFDVAGRPLIVRAELQRLATRESTVEADATAASAR